MQREVEVPASATIRGWDLKELGCMDYGALRVMDRPARVPGYEIEAGLRVAQAPERWMVQPLRYTRIPPYG